MCIDIHERRSYRTINQRGAFFSKFLDAKNDYAFKQGMQQALHNIAKSTRAQNMPTEAIAAVAGLTQDGILLIE